MLRNVNGIWMYSQPAADRWVMTTHRLGNGHAECSISRAIEWKEMDPDAAAMLGQDWAEELAKPLSDEEQAEREERNRKRAARRAKTRIRRLVKVMGLNALFTLTYRANQTDLALCKKHFKEFVRRARRVLPGFRYVAAFERQKRGAWHVHMVTDRLPKMLAASNGVKVKSYNVMRSIWRAITKDLGGNFDQARKVRSGRQSVAKLAGYISKYLVKAFEDGDAWSNRYSASMDVEMPLAQRLEFNRADLGDLISLAYGDIASGDCEITTWLSPYRDSFYLAVEPVQFDRSAHCRK